MKVFESFVERYLVSLILATVLIVVFVGVEYQRIGDFDIYLESSEALFGGQNIYSRLYGPDSVFEYFGSPFLSWVLRPFTWIPRIAAAALWKILNILILLRCWTLLSTYFEVRHWSLRQQRWMQALVFALLVFPIYRNLHLVQLTIVLLYLALEALHQSDEQNRPAVGGLLLAAGILTKVTLIVILPYLIYRGKFKTFLFLLLALAVMIVLPATVVGWEQNQLLWNDWIGMINPTSSENLFDMNNRKNQGVSALIATLFIEGIRNGESSVFLRRHIVNLNPETVQWIILGARLALVSFFLYFLRWPPFRKAKNKVYQLWEISYLFLVIPLLFPQQRPYNFVFLMPAFVYALYFFRTRGNFRNAPALVFFALAFILNLELLAGDFRNYYWHYKSLTYIGLIAAVLIAGLTPEKARLNVR